MQPHTSSEVVWVAPQPIAPLNGEMFVNPSPSLSWNWSGLQENQAYVVRLWLDENPEDYRELWSSIPSVNPNTAIESYGEEVGLFYWQVAVARISQEQGFEGMISEWSPVRAIQRVRHINPTPFPPSMQSDAARYVASQDFETATEMIDKARNFIYLNSTEQYGQEPGLPDRSDTLQQMFDYSQGRAEIAKVYCDGQSTAMLTLLLELGIDARLIFLYGGVQGSIVEHTLLEVFNPDTQRWELQDPNHNYYLVDDKGERISIERAVFSPTDSLLACDPDQCTKQKLEWFQAYFQAFRYGYSDEIWVNPDRFDVTKRFADEDDLNLAEYLTNGNPRQMIFRFDSEQIQ